MKTSSRVVLMLMLAALLAGCATVGPPTPRMSLRTATDTYAVTISVLAEYRTIGLIDDEAGARIEEVRLPARLALDAWLAALMDGRPASEAIADFNRYITVLLTERLRTERLRTERLRTERLRAERTPPP